MLTIFAKLIAGAVAVYAILIALLFFSQSSMIFVPDKTAYTLKDVGPSASAFSEITVKTEDGLTLRGWYSASQPGRHTVVIFHGNGSTWQWRAPDFAPLVDAGYGVLLAGYRGYGGNPGAPSEKGLYRDAEAYLAFLKSQEVPSELTVLYGESMGTGVAIEMAVRHPNLAGMILEAPFSTAAEMASYHYPFVPLMDYFIRTKFENLYKIGAITMPKLFYVAGMDTVLPKQYALKLYEAAPQPKTLREFRTAGHNDMRQMGANAQTLAFLNSLRK